MTWRSAERLQQTASFSRPCPCPSPMKAEGFLSKSKCSMPAYSWQPRDMGLRFASMVR